MLTLLWIGCGGLSEQPAPTEVRPREGDWLICREQEPDPGGFALECREQALYSQDSRYVGFAGRHCDLDWPAIRCWSSEGTQDYSEYRDIHHVYPDETVALLGYFSDSRTFVGREVEATTWTEVDEDWPGGWLERYAVSARFLREPEVD